MKIEEESREKKRYQRIRMLNQKLFDPTVVHLWNFLLGWKKDATYLTNVNFFMRSPFNDGDYASEDTSLISNINYIPWMLTIMAIQVVDFSNGGI